MVSLQAAVRSLSQCHFSGNQSLRSLCCVQVSKIFLLLLLLLLLIPVLHPCWGVALCADGSLRSFTCVLPHILCNLCAVLSAVITIPHLTIGLGLKIIQTPKLTNYPLRIHTPYTGASCMEIKICKFFISDILILHHDQQHHQC